MNSIKGYAYLFAAFTLAGTSVISARFVSGKLGTFTITAASLLFAVLFLLPLCGSKLRETVRMMTGKEWLLLMLQAVCGIFLFRLFLLQGLLHTSAGEAGILTGATPTITALLAATVLRERMDGKSIAGILFTISGILLLQGVLLPGGKFAPEHLAGNALVLCAAASESTFGVISRFNSLRSASPGKQPINPLVQTTLVSVLAFIPCLALSLFEHPVQTMTAIGPTEWLALVWYGVFVTALAFIFWYSGIKRCPAYSAAAFSGMMPFTALILSVIILGEPAGFRQWSGGLLVACGMLLIGFAGQKERKQQKERERQQKKLQQKEEKQQKHEYLACKRRRLYNINE